MATTSQHNSTEERALHLLGQGIPPETVASACGVSASRISQLLSTPEFLAQVSELRFANLEKHNIIDSKYDDMESKLMEKLNDSLPLMGMEPMKILKAVQVINGAKRRGVSAPEQITQQQTVVQLIMPNVIMQKFSTNINNQVIQAGEQNLQTIQSHMLAGMYQNKSELNTIAATPPAEPQLPEPSEAAKAAYMLMAKPTQKATYDSQALDASLSELGLEI